MYLTLAFGTDLGFLELLPSQSHQTVHGFPSRLHTITFRSDLVCAVAHDLRVDLVVLHQTAPGII